MGIYADGGPLLGWQMASAELQEAQRAFFWMGIGLYAATLIGGGGEFFRK